MAMFYFIFFLASVKMITPLKESQPLVIGHRGYGTNKSKENPYFMENTLNSFQKAHDCGANGVEFDVHLTKDHVPVIFHDFRISLNDINLCIHELLLKDFLLAGRQHVERERGNLDPKNFRNLPGTLESLLEHLSPSLVFNIELKYPDENEKKKYKIEGIYSREKLVEKTLNVVRRYKERRMFFSSFDMGCLLALTRYKNNFDIFFLNELVYNGKMNDLIPRFAQELRTCILNNIKGIVFNASKLNGNHKTLFEFLQSLSLRIILYGKPLNDVDHVQRISELGLVDGFIVDNVDGVRGLFSSLH